MANVGEPFWRSEQTRQLTEPMTYQVGQFCDLWGERDLVESMSGVVCEPMVDRIATFRVLAGGDVLVGHIRLDQTDCRWVARDLGSERRAASLRRFCDKQEAVEWLVAREPVAPRQPRRAAA